jgi:hypothetical protein
VGTGGSSLQKICSFNLGHGDLHKKSLKKSNKLTSSVHVRTNQILLL